MHHIFRLIYAEIQVPYLLYKLVPDDKNNYVKNNLSIGIDIRPPQPVPNLKIDFEGTWHIAYRNTFSGTIFQNALILVIFSILDDLALEINFSKVFINWKLWKRSRREENFLISNLKVWNLKHRVLRTKSTQNFLCIQFIRYARMASSLNKWSTNQTYS